MRNPWEGVQGITRNYIPPMPVEGSTRVSFLGALTAAVVFLALSLPGAGARGIVAEEVQPTLARYPHVLDATPDAGLLAPYEIEGAPSPRWVATQQWPVLAYDGQTRVWPVFIRGHQTALGSWASIALQPVLGGGVEGLQRASGVLSALLILAAWWLASRLGLNAVSLPHGVAPGGFASAVVAGLMTVSFGTLFFSRTGYSFELASRLGLVLSLAIAAPLQPLSRARAAALGLVVGLTLLSRATIGVTLFPALAVLFLHDGRRSSRSMLALAGGLSVAIPFLFVALVTALVPFASGTGPLAEFPWERLGPRMLEAPGHLAVQLAWLGDANAILDPLRSGTVPGGTHFVIAVALGVIPFSLAMVRWWRGTAGDGERMLVVAVLSNATVGAALYNSPAQFQLAIALDVLLALALLEQVMSLRGRAVLVALGAVLLVKSYEVARGLRGDATVATPMFSFRAQHAALEQLQALGAKGPDVMTTTYNQAGVLEAWTGGSLAPTHAWLLLRRPKDVPSEWPREELKRALSFSKPRFVLLSSGPNAMDGPFADNAAVEQQLPNAALALGARLAQRWDFPTESGGPGWALVELAW